MGDTNDRSEPGSRKGKPPFRSTDWRQTGTCDEAQADGVPCPEPDCDCEKCAQSKLARDRSSSHRRRT
jgi:hypothetical protein